MSRAAAPETRNPLLALPAAHDLRALLIEQPETRRRLHALLRALGDQASERAEDSWRRRKGPMAAYWRAVSIYARHIAAVVGTP